MQENDKINISPDALIAMLMLEAEARELAQLPNIEEVDVEFHPSEEFERQMEKLIQQEKQKERKKERRKAVKRCLISVSATLSLFFVIMSPVKAVQNAVVNTLIEWKDKFMTVIFSSEGVPAIALPQIELQYIPEGFTLTMPVNEKQNTYFANYTDRSGRECTIRISIIDTLQSYMIDSEYTSYYSIVSDTEQFVWGTLKDESNILLWEEDGLSFQISGNLDLSEMLKIYRGIVF